MTVYLHGLGHFHPDNEITNAFLVDLDIGTTEDWIDERVGVHSRRTVLPLDYIRETRNADPRATVEAAEYTSAELAVPAARMALKRAGLEASDIGLVLAGSSAADTCSPAEACNLAALLGIEAPAFDTNSACTSFFAPLYLLSMMDPARVPRFILIATPETMTRTVDYSDRGTAVLWGDGAAAAVVSLTEPARAQVIEATLNSSPAGHDKVVVPRIGFFRQEGQVVQKFAVKRTALLLKQLQKDHAQAGRRLGFVGHQANLRMLENVCRMCRIEPDNHHSNVADYGNTAAAGSPSVVSMGWDRFGDADDLAVIGVGAGLTWASYLLRFLR